jgi:hypothetical protein
MANHRKHTQDSGPIFFVAGLLVLALVIGGVIYVSLNPGEQITSGPAGLSTPRSQPLSSSDHTKSAPAPVTPTR